MFWIMLRCFWDRGAKRGSNEDSTLFVYLDKLLTWVIITIRLLCLCFDENRFMGWNLPCFETRWVWSKNPIVAWMKIEKTDFFMFSLYFWLGPLYISKAIAPSTSFSFGKFTHYQIGALRRQRALGRAQ